jgi:glycosyltransferase involved in cell wall biosynthesis
MSASPAPALTVIILTFNEQARLPACLDSLAGLDAKLFAVDSYSTDATLDILRGRGVPYAQHPFADYAAQRNWAQANNPHATEWVLHLDADERLTPELAAWLRDEFPRLAPEAAGFLFSRRTMFMGRWIKHGGHYPAFHLRLYRAGAGHCERKAYDQHFVADGPLRRIDGADIVDTVAADLSQFTASHNRWASFEADESVAGGGQGEVQARLGGSPIERRRWLKTRVFGALPLFARSFLYFFYRYVLRLGFLDGAEGLVFHVLQGFWFRFLVDAKILEARKRGQPGPRHPLKQETP